MRPTGNAATQHSMPIVLVHGFMQDGRTWAGVRALLPSTLQTIAPTLEPVDECHSSLDDLADQVREAVGDRAPALLVGYSMGGRVLLSYARRYPQTIGALVLESAGLGPESKEERIAYAERSERWAKRFRGGESREQLVDWWESLPLFRTQAELPEPTKAASRSMRLSCDPDRLAWLTEHAGVHTMPYASEARAELASLPCPVYYVYGKRDQKYARAAQTLDSQNVRLRSFEAGHNVHMEQPRAFASLLAGIAAKGPERPKEEEEEGRI